MKHLTPSEQTEALASLAALTGDDTLHTVVVSIGRNVSKDTAVRYLARHLWGEYGEQFQLSPEGWTSFQLATLDALNVYASTLLSSTTGEGSYLGETEETAVWLALVPAYRLSGLRSELADLATQYGQEAIGFTAAISASTLVGAR